MDDKSSGNDTGLEIVPVKKATTELSAAQLTKVMEAETKRRAVITEYITKNMKEGMDFGTIQIETRSGGKVESKPSLFKPGSEKFLSLFKLRAEFEMDRETWEMTGSEKNVFCYICRLIASNGAVVGEGRGSSKLSEKMNWTVNNAVKIAEKRAQIDAVLRTGALSDFFTQDLEDMQPEQPARQPMKPYQVPRRVPPAEDEAQGKRGKGYEYPEMNEMNDAHGIAEPKKVPDQVKKNALIIKELLNQLGRQPEDAKQAIMYIQMLTGGMKKGWKWQPGTNDDEIISKLREINQDRLNGLTMFESTEEK